MKTAKQGISVLAPSFLRLGYHAQRRHMILSKASAKNPAHGVHGKSLKQAAEASAAIVDAIGTRRNEDAAHAVWEYVGTRNVRAALKKGGHIDLVLRLDQIIRNSGNTSAYSWWQIGLTCAALEGAALPKKDREANLTILKGKLNESAIPKAVLTSLLEVRDQDRLQMLEGSLKEMVPEGFGGDLAILKAQHAEGLFPDKDLLERLGCFPAGIDYMEHLYEARPKGVTHAEAGKKFGVGPQAIHDRYDRLPPNVRNILLIELTGNQTKAWRPA